MAPEQTDPTAERIGAWTDVYLLGAILYYIMTLTFPHDARTAAAAFDHAREGTFEHPRRRARAHALPDDLVNLCLEALEPDPGKRLGSADEFVRRLREFLMGSRVRRESIALSEEVERLLPLSQTYEDLQECLTRTAKALSLWPGNQSAVLMQHETSARFAAMAIGTGDLVLARLHIGHLPECEERSALQDRLLQAEKEQRRLERHRTLATRLLATAAIALLAGFAFGVISLMNSQNEIERERDAALTSREEAAQLARALFDELERGLDPVEDADVLAAAASRALGYLRGHAPETLAPTERRQHAEGLLRVGGILLKAGARQEAAEAAREAQRCCALFAGLEPENSSWERLREQAGELERAAW
jgi:hypothetical protein